MRASVLCHRHYYQCIYSPGSVDAVGSEFTLFFEENAARKEGWTFNVQLFITTYNDEPVNVKVSMPLAEQFEDKNVIVNKGQVTEVDYPQEAMHIGSGISNRCSDKFHLF